MRTMEFANAEDALALWKIISDNTWAAVQQQAEAEAIKKAEQAAAAKSRKPKRGKVPKPRSVPVAPLPPKPPSATAAKPTVPTKPKPQANVVQQQQRQSLSQPVSPNSKQPQSSAATQTIQPIPTIKPVQHMLPAKPKPTLKAAAGGMSLQFTFACANVCLIHIGHEAHITMFTVGDDRLCTNGQSA